MLCDKSGEKLLLLAEGLLKKHIASHSMHEPEGTFHQCLLLYKCCRTISDFFTLSSTNGSMVFSALMVYISLLEQESKYNDALEVLSGDLGSLLMIEVDKLRIQVGYKDFWAERTLNFMLFYYILRTPQKLFIFPIFKLNLSIYIYIYMLSLLLYAHTNSLTLS